MTPLVLDIETNQSLADRAKNKKDAKRKSLSPFRSDARILYIGLWYPGKNEPLAYLHEDKAFKIITEAVKKKVPLLMHNGKYDLLWLLANGLELPKAYCFEDTMLLAHSAGKKNLSLDALIKSVLGKASHKGMVNKEELENSLFQDDIKAYCIQDVQETFEIWKALGDKRKKPLYKFLCDLSRAVLSMEYNGLYINKENVKKLEKELLVKINELEKQTQALGFKVNLGSSDQAVKFLKYYGYKGEDTNSNNLLLARVQLKKGELAQAIDLVLKYRKIAKILNTFVPLLFNNYGDRLHSNYYLIPYEGNGARSGRLSSVPNAQNFPGLIKKILTAPEGYQYLAPDYSQVELRIGALLANEKKLLQAFKEGQDIHADTVNMIKSLGTINVEDPDKLRTIAKSWNFGVGMYGAGAPKAQIMLAKAGVYAELDDIKAISRQWKRLYPNISKNANRFRDKAEKEGYLITPTGRKRRFTETQINAAANHPIQSLASDICQTGTYLVWNKLCDSEVKLVASEHDKLILEYPKTKNYEGIEKEVSRLMTSETKREFAERFGFEINVPIKVDAKIKGSL